MKYRWLFVLGLVSTLVAPVAAQSITTQRTGDSDSMPPGLARGSAHLECSCIELSRTTMMTARLRGAGCSGFSLYSQLDGGQKLDPSTWVFVGRSSTNADGNGELHFPVPAMAAAITNVEMAYFAVYLDDAGTPRISETVPFVLNPVPRATLAFGRDMTGAALPAGVEIREQWGGIGVHVAATNGTSGHPDKAILYDSSDSGGMDPDLVTPGYGPMNHRAFGNVLIIPEDDLDLNGDGYVDQPNDEAGGGIITFGFDEPMQLADIALIDIDRGETVVMRGFDGDRLVQDVLFDGIGDNSVMRIGFSAQEVTRLEIALSGSGAVGTLSVHGMLDRARVASRPDRGAEGWTGP